MSFNADDDYPPAQLAWDRIARGLDPDPDEPDSIWCDACQDHHIWHCWFVELLDPM